jgi:hypothetical protein
LLVGLLFDDRGNRLSPSHVTKKGKRYRYYVSQAVLQNKRIEPGAVSRMPAQEIEDLVTTTIATKLQDQHWVTRQAAPYGTAISQHAVLIAGAAELAARLRYPGVERKRGVLRAFVHRVTIDGAEVTIEMSREQLCESLLAHPTAECATSLRKANEIPNARDRLVVRVEAELKRYSREMRFVAPSRGSAEPTSRPNAALVRALTRAYRWHQLLMSGRMPSIRAIAKAEALTESYVGRIHKLAFLAPDMVEAILDCRQPSTLDLGRLLEGISPIWDEQRQRFGRAPRPGLAPAAHSEIV